METILQHPLFKPLLITVALICLTPLVALYTVLTERKVLGDFQIRLGPMRVGPHGLLQPFADAVKLLTKEDTIPADADRALFWLGPVVSTFTALTAFCVVPFSSFVYVADVNVGLLVISAMSAVGVLGIILGGWASNSHYPLLGSLRSAAQLISYEVAVGLALMSGVMAAGTLSLQSIVRAQQERHIWFVFSNYGLMIVPFMVYFISSIAETNRLPFDLPEAESELVAGFHTEYSGMRWALYFLAEYANMYVVSAVAVALFLGGWLRPFPNVKALAFLDVIPPVLWFVLKVAAFLFVYIWFRGTFPRYRFDQLMALGWKTLIPISLVNLVLVALAALGGTRGLRILGAVLWVVAAGAFLIVTRLRAAKTAPAPAGARAAEV